MLIKQQALTGHLRQKLAAVYVLFGQDPFLLNQAAENIKAAWQIKSNSESDQQVVHINSPADWNLVDQQANSYSLFSSSLLLDIRYDKKTLEVAATNFLSHYLDNINPDCLILLRMPNLPQKQLQLILNHPLACAVQVSTLNNQAMQHWINEQLQSRAMTFEPGVPALIQQYTQGNMLACAQVIEKLDLVINEQRKLSITEVKEQLVDQCDYQLFELAEACLEANSAKVIQLLRHAADTKAEPILVLWILTQELRLLIQLAEQSQDGIPFNTACSQLKIWPQRARLYQSSLKNKSVKDLLVLLSFCQRLDERIKSSSGNQIWHALEQVALSLCLNKLVGHFA